MRRALRTVRFGIWKRRTTRYCFGLMGQETSLLIKTWPFRLVNVIVVVMFCCYSTQPIISFLTYYLQGPGE